MAYESGWQSIVQLQTGVVVSNKFNLAFYNIDLALADIDGVLNGTGYDYVQLKPTDTPPDPLAEGMLYYDNPTHSLVAINDIAGTKLNIGYEVVERCSNHTGSIIRDGKVVAVGNIDVDDNFEMILADSNLLDTAVAFGVTTSESDDGQIALVTREGRVNDIDTVGIPVNGTAYLGNNGNLTGTPPPITTVIGYVVKAQSAPGEADGVIYISPRSIISLPNVVAFMNQSAPTASASLGATPFTVINYDSDDSGGVIMSYEVGAGTILAPADGIYDMTIDFGTNYTDIGNNVQHLLVEIMADNGVDAPRVVGQYNKEVAKNSTSTNGSMTKTFKGEIDTTYYMRMSCPDDTFASFVLENVSFSLKSIDIR